MRSASGFAAALPQLTPATDLGATALAAYLLTDPGLSPAP
jgi:hypothetical protein